MGTFLMSPHGDIIKVARHGNLAFPNSESATEGIQSFAHTIQHIDLHWGDDLRVDPLTPDFAVVATPWVEVQIDLKGHHLTTSGFFTALAENRNGQWQFRNAHWSEPVPSLKVPRFACGGLRDGFRRTVWP